MPRYVAPHSRTTDRQIMETLIRYHLGTTTRLARLVDVTLPSAQSWRRGSRPRALTLTRLCRLVMWGVHRWPEDGQVHWDAMRITPPGLVTPDPFRLSATVWFGYGGQRDRATLLDDVMTRFGIEHKNHLGRLLGCPERYQFHWVNNWMKGIGRMGSMYMARLLGLLLWDWGGYALNDMWQVDWQTRTIEWSWDGRSGAPKPMSGNPFDWMAAAGRRRKVIPSLRVTFPPRPVRDLAYA